MTAFFGESFRAGFLASSDLQAVAHTERQSFLTFLMRARALHLLLYRETNGYTQAGLRLYELSFH